MRKLPAILASLAVAALGGAASLQAVVVPYNVDSATLHLWHFDEAVVPCQDAIVGGTALTAAAGGATLGNSSFPGFGSALSTLDGGQEGTSSSSRNASLSPVTLASGSADNVTLTFANETNGAFTFEAIVRIQFNPALDLGPAGVGRNSSLQIFSAEGDVAAERIFQWRLNPVGVGPGDTSVPRLEFISLNQETAIQSVLAAIPTTGPHAIASNEWYHVAVTYDGNAGAAGNFLFYWTRLISTNSSANLIASATLNDDLFADVSCDFVVGNEGRATGGTSDNFLGLIDEVRISRVARGPFDFLFTGGDTDADGLPDAWENLHFGSLAQGAGGDPDGDTFTNMQEYLAGTDPLDPNSPPATPSSAPPPLTQYIPIEDGDTNTSEFGYAGGSSINAVAFIRSALMTVSNQQFIAYYGRHATDSTWTNNNRIVIARRNLSSTLWEVFRIPYTADAITDGHDVVVFGMDGAGYMHISWGMHANSFHYARSTAPVTGNQPIAFGPDSTMTGGENNVTYPQFLTMPNGDLLYLYREGSSGAGDTFINRYSLATQTWTNQQFNAGQKPFVKGTGWVPDYNCYPNLPCLDTNGNLFFIWVWRDTSAYQSNHDFSFAKSTNGGLTWLRFDGTPYTLPISASGENGDPNTTAERILTIPQNSSLINQAGMCLDQSGQPVVASWWAPGTPTNNFRRQYMLLLRSTNDWIVRQVSQRTNDPPGTRFSDGNVRDLGRPVVVSDRQDRLIVLYRDNAGSNGLTIAHSLPRAMDPDRLVWTTFDLTTENLGFYEPVIDNERWARDGILDILYQPAAGLGYSPPANTAAQIGVFEWNATAYFAHRPDLELKFVNGGQDAAVSFPSQPGWGYKVQSSTNLLAWETFVTLNGTGGTLQYTRTNAVADGFRFWRLEIKEGGFGP